MKKALHIAPPKMVISWFFLYVFLLWKIITNAFFNKIKTRNLDVARAKWRRISIDWHMNWIKSEKTWRSTNSRKTPKSKKSTNRSTPSEDEKRIRMPGELCVPTLFYFQTKTDAESLVSFVNYQYLIHELPQDVQVGLSASHALWASACEETAAAAAFGSRRHQHAASFMYVAECARHWPKLAPWENRTARFLYTWAAAGIPSGRFEHGAQLCAGSRESGQDAAHVSRPFEAEGTFVSHDSALVSAKFQFHDLWAFL